MEKRLRIPRCSLRSAVTGVAAVTVVVLLFGCGSVNAREVSLSWLHNAEAVDGYELYVWKDSVPVTQDNAELIATSFTLRLGDGTSYVLKNLLDDSTYYFAIKAYREGELDSPFSDILRLDSLVLLVADFIVFTTDKSLTVTFDGTPSRGAVQSFSWNFGDGSVSSKSIPSHTYVQEGMYNVTLTVNDSAGRISSMDNTIELSALNGVNILPKAVASASDGIGTAPLTVRFDGTESMDPDGGDLSYFWSFGDGSQKTGSGLIAHTYDNPGRYSCVLTVIDDKGGESSQKIPVIVSAPQVAQVVKSLPVPNFSVQKHLDEASRKNSLMVSFDASMSKPSREASGIKEYLWNLGDGTIAKGMKISHYYPGRQEYRATLTITDSKNKKASASSLVDLERVDSHLRVPVCLPFFHLLLDSK